MQHEKGRRRRRGTKTIESIKWKLFARIVCVNVRETYSTYIAVKINKKNNEQKLICVI